MGNTSIDLTNREASTYPKIGRVYYSTNISNIIGAPAASSGSTSSCIVWIDNRSGFVQQYIQELQEQGRLFVRDVAMSSLAQDNWIQVTAPSFYKNYNSLAELKAALAAI